MRKSLSIMIPILVVAAFATSAGAITNGEKDSDGLYPFVGMLAFYDSGGSYLHRCSGTLLSSTVMVTASHCTDGTSLARAYFDAEVTDDFRNNPRKGTVGTPVTHPDYNPLTIDNDVAVVLLSKQVRVRGGYPTLPDEGFLDDLKRTHEIQDDLFVAVGYGGSASFPPSVLEFDLFRRFVSSQYGSLTQNNLHLEQNPNSTGSGGTCFGDSGGPHFWEDTLVLVSVTSWGDAICRSNDMTQRLDIASAHDFVSSFVS